MTAVTGMTEDGQLVARLLTQYEQVWERFDAVGIDGDPMNWRGRLKALTEARACARQLEQMADGILADTGSSDQAIDRAAQAARQVHRMACARADELVILARQPLLANRLR